MLHFPSLHLYTMFYSPLSLSSKTKLMTTMPSMALIVLPLMAIFLFSTLAQAELIKSSQSHFAKHNFHKNPSISSTSCKNTPYPSACETLLKTTTFPRTKQGLFDRSVELSMAKTHLARALAYNLSVAASSKRAEPRFVSALDDCLELLDDTVDLLSSVVSYGNDKEIRTALLNDDDVHSWLSAALTNQETCLDGLKTGRSDDRMAAERDGAMEATTKTLSRLIGNSLSLFLSTKTEPDNNLNGGGGRRLLSEGGDFPAWLPAADRKLLEASVEEIEPHAVVAKDGSGTHGSIAEALEFAASMASGGRTVIYVKAGTYNEYIKIPTKQKNVMLVGDGKGKSVIVGSKNSEAGSTTYNSATVGK